MLSKMFKVMSVILCFSLIISIFYFNPTSSFAASAVPWGAAFNKVSDPDTSNPFATKVFDLDIIENGKLWMDKTVNKDAAVITDNYGAEVATITAATDEFVITLSALSEAYSLGSTIPPLDVVFIVDVSGSMTYGFDESEGAVGDRRIDALVDALNQAIYTLMTNNTENRIAVVAYGGLAGRHPRAYNMLSLGRYTDTSTSGSDYFSVQPDEVYTDPYNSDYFTTGDTDAFLTVNATVTGTTVNGDLVPLLSAVPVLGGTPTQRGIITGANVLLNNSDKTYTDDTDPSNPITVIRQPIMILLTDGEPTFGWTNYEEAMSASNNYDDYDWGDALTPDIGIDILTVATASYCKQEVQDWYYGNSTANSVGFYTIGVYIENNHTMAVLDPKNNAQNNNQVIPPPPLPGGVTYNMKTLIDPFVNTTGGNIQFPVLNHGVYPALSTTWTSININNPLNYVTSYFYSDGFFEAEDAEGLDEAFATITTEIVSMYTFITNIGTGGDADFDGYLTFSDVLGEYMEFRSYTGLWFADKPFTDANFYSYIGAATPGSGANWNTFISTLATQMEVAPSVADAVVRSCITANMITPSGVNKISWYADNEKNYVGPYYSGTSIVPPSNYDGGGNGSGAMCIMDLYPISGTVTSDVTGEDVDLTLVSFVVLTAIEPGLFYDADVLAMNVTPRELVVGQQIVRLYVPASLIPMRTVEATVDETTGMISAEIINASPIHAVYSVGLQEYIIPKSDPASDPALPNSYYIEGISDAYKQYYRTPPGAGFGALYHFFTNQWKLPPANISDVFCEIAPDNPYYFCYDPSGFVPLYIIDDTGDYILALEGDKGPYYLKEQYYDDRKAPDYIRDVYKQVDINVVQNATRSLAPNIPSGTERSIALGLGATFDIVGKAPGTAGNPTGTNTYIVQTNEMIISTDGTTGDTYYTQIRQLGNNGRISIPVTQVIVEKLWYGVPQTAIDIQLLVETDVIEPVEIDSVELSPDAGWRYAWYTPDEANNYRELLVYTYYPDPQSGTVDFLTYSLFEENPGEYQTSYQPPVFNPSNNSWSVGIITNGTPPIVTTPPPPGGNNAGTGDNSDMLFWWLLLNISLLGLCLIYKVRERYLVKR